MAIQIVDRADYQNVLAVNPDGSINVSSTGGSGGTVVVDQVPFARDTNTFAIAVSDVASSPITFTGGTGTRVRVANAGANPVAFRIDATAPVFPTVGTNQPVYVVLPGSVEVFEAGAAGVSLQAICAAGLTSTLYVCMGTGV